MISLGIDTSNYTTSIAFYDSESQEIKQKKKLLPVRAGEKGLRQSDAVFHHTVQLPEITKELFQNFSGHIDSVGVSVSPRRIEGSYMPCFLAGKGFAESYTSIQNVPLYSFSHQEGHIVAALYSANCLTLLEHPFLAFHLSGGTTEALYVTPSEQHILSAELVLQSLDLKAGQLIDRVGVMLGLSFPCGPALEELSKNATKSYKIHATMKDGNCCLSGIENQCQKLKAEGESSANIAKFCMDNIIEAVNQMILSLHEKYGSLPIVFSGGVSGNQQMQSHFLKKYKDVYFAEPVFSSDNAAGIAILTAMMQER